jgi:hypothetical protein
MQPDISLVLPHAVHDRISMGALNVRILVKNNAALEMVNSIFRLKKFCPNCLLCLDEQNQI